MPILKGMKKDGYIYINNAVSFRKGIEFFDNWQDTYYVDPINGDDSNAGISSYSHLLNLAKALEKAGALDVIYIKPKFNTSLTGGDPVAITPATAANWAIGTTQYGLSIIGCGKGVGASKAQQTLLQGHASVTSSPVLDIKAPYCNIENLGFKNGASTVGMLRSMFTDAVRYAFGSTFYNLWFRLAGAVGGLITDAAWYDHILGCTFSSCLIGIYIGASNSVPKGLEIEDCDFDGLTSEIDVDIFASGAVTRLNAHDLRFNHAVPAGGSNNRYVKIGATSTGLISNCLTGAVDPTIADNMTLNGVLYSNIWGDGVGPFVDA